MKLYFPVIANNIRAGINFRHESIIDGFISKNTEQSDNIKNINRSKDCKKEYYPKIRTDKGTNFVIHPDNSACQRLHLAKAIEESASLTLESGGILDCCLDSEYYDFPFRFATICYNSKNINHGRIIGRSTPEIFKGMSQDDIFSAFNQLSLTISKEDLSLNKKNVSDLDKNKSSIMLIYIAGKIFYIKPIDIPSAECHAYVVSDDLNDDSNSVIFKAYKLFSPLERTIGSSGFFGNIGMLREANIAGVVDVPELYYANPIIKPDNISGQSGAWVIEENANYKTIKQDGITLEDLLARYGLGLFDNRTRNSVNGVHVDLGYIRFKNKPEFNSNFGECVYSKYVVEGLTPNNVANFFRDIPIRLLNVTV